MKDRTYEKAMVLICLLLGLLIILISIPKKQIIETKKTEFIGQHINYANLQQTPMISIDKMNLDRVDLIKIDVEGMEMEALNGAKDTIRTAKPHLIIEKIKSLVLCQVSSIPYKLTIFEYFHVFID